MIRFSTSYTGFRAGHFYEVEIHDNETSGTPIGIDLGPDAVVFKYDADSEDRNTRIKTTSCMVSLCIAEQAHEDFLIELGLAHENQFWIKIKKDGNNEFIGKILPNLIDIEDRPFPYFARIKATDGINSLKDISYVSAQTQSIFDDVADGKFEAILAEDREYLQSPNSELLIENVFNTEVIDRGDNYLILFSNYSREIVCDFFANIRVRGRPEDDNDIRLEFWKNADRVHETTVTFPKNVTTEKTLQLDLKDVSLIQGDSFSCKVWRDNDFIDFTIYEGAKFYNVIPDIRRTFKNVYAPIIEHIKNALSLINTAYLYDPTDIYFVSAIQWQPDSETVPLLDKIGISYNSFVTNFSKDPVTVVSAYEVLLSIANRFNGYFRYTKGRYSFEQLDTYKADTDTIQKRSLSQYDRTFSYLGENILAYTDWQKEACLSGGRYRYLRALGCAEVQYKRILTPDLIFGTEALLHGEIATFDYIGQNAELRFTIKIRNILLAWSFGGADYRNEYRVLLKINGKWAFSENLNPTQFYDPPLYSPPEWRDTESYLEVWGNSRVNSGADLDPYTIEATFVLPAVLEDGQIEYSVQFVRSHFLNENLNTDPQFYIPINNEYDLEDTLIHIGDDDASLREQLVHTLKCNTNNSKKIVVPVRFSMDTIFDEDPGRMVKLDGAEWIDIGHWLYSYTSNGSLSTTQIDNIDILLAHSLISSQQLPLMVYVGRFIAGSTYDEVYIINGKRALFNRGSFYTRLNEIEGEWIEVQDGNIEGILTSIKIDDEEASNTTSSLPGSSSTTIVNNNSGGGGGVVEVFQSFGNVTGTHVNVTVAPLPDPASFTDAIINNKILLIRDKWVLEYPTHYQIDKVNERILCDLDDERLSLRIKIN